MPPGDPPSFAFTNGDPSLRQPTELETLEKVTETIDKISVFGGLEGVLNDLVKIR